MNPLPLPPNPLLPMVREMAERIVKLESRMTGKLWAKSSTGGPQSINELRVLLGRNGMWAAAWLLERTVETEDDLATAELDAEDLRVRLDEAQAAVASLEGKLQYIHKLTITEGTPDNEQRTE